MTTSRCSWSKATLLIPPPRVYFRGQFRANAATGNNYQMQRFCGTLPITEDCTTQVRVFDVATATVNVLKDAGGRELTDDEMLQVLAANQPRMWNYQGANTINFEDVTITGVDLGAGVRPDDPLVGARVLMDRAAMVDINPAGILNTQIFSDDFVVEAGGLTLRGVPTRSYSRWVWFARNPSFAPFYPPTGQASGVFQAALPASSLSLEGSGSAAHSALAAALAKGDAAGLTVRFCLYAMRTREEGPRNPGWGQVTGVIGLKLADEMDSYPVSRRLQPAAATDGALGPAFARVDVAARTVTLDLVTTVPEADVALQKQRLGTLRLRVAGDGDGPYDRLRDTLALLAAVRRARNPSWRPRRLSRGLGAGWVSRSWSSFLFGSARWPSMAVESCVVCPCGPARRYVGATPIVHFRQSPRVIQQDPGLTSARK